MATIYNIEVEFCHSEINKVKSNDYSTEEKERLKEAKKNLQEYVKSFKTKVKDGDTKRCAISKSALEMIEELETQIKSI